MSVCRLSVCPSGLSVCLSFRFVCMSVCLFVSLSVVGRLSLLSVCLSVCRSLCLFVSLSVCPVCLSVAAFVGTELRLCAQIGRRCPLQVPALELSVEDTDDGVPALDQSF